MQFNKGRFNKGKFNRIDGKTYLATATLLGSSGVSVSAYIKVSADIQINGLGVYNAESIRVQLNTANIIGEGNITGIPAIWLYASSELTGAFDVICRAEGQGLAIVRAELLGNGDVLPLPFAIRYSQSAYEGLGMFYSYSHRTTFPTVEVSGEGNITSNINMTTSIYVDLIARGDIHATPISVILTSGELEGLSNLEAFGGILNIIEIELSGNGLISANSAIEIIGTALLEGKSNIIAIPFTLYMPPFTTIPTRLLIIDMRTIPIVEESVTMINITDTNTKVVFI